VYCIVKNGLLDLDAVWTGGSAGSKDEVSRPRRRWRSPRAGAILAVDVGRPTVTNGDFVT